MKRLVVVFIGLLLLATGCTTAERPEDKVQRFLTKVEKSPYQYVYQEQTKGLKVEVRGRVEDTIRHTESLFVDGAKVMERIVRDDLMAVQVSAPDLVPDLNAAQPPDMAVANVLRSGQWVIDPAGAPTLETNIEVERASVGQDPLVDAAEIFQYMRLSIQQGAGVALFNPDALEYRHQEDPFPQPKKTIGEERYDLLRLPLPTRAGGQLPGAGPFRKMSFYLVGGKLVRVLEKIDLEGHEDFVRAQQTRRNRFHLELMRDLREGRGPEQIRNREMAFQILSQGEEVTIDPPLEGFSGNLSVLFARKKQQAAQTPPQLPEGVTNPLQPSPAAEG